MRMIITAGIIAASIFVLPVVAQAGTLEGVGIGAGTGAVIAGPPGAIVGGVIGAVVGGPNIVSGRRYDRRGSRHCWTDRRGDRHCSWR